MTNQLKVKLIIVVSGLILAFVFLVGKKPIGHFLFPLLYLAGGLLLLKLGSLAENLWVQYLPQLTTRLMVIHIRLLPSPTYIWILRWFYRMDRLRNRLEAEYREATPENRPWAKFKWILMLFVLWSPFLLFFLALLVEVYLTDTLFYGKILFPLMYLLCDFSNVVVFWIAEYRRLMDEGKVEKE